MPALQLLLTSTSSTVSIPSQFNAKHLHLKAVVVRFDQAAASTAMEINLPFLRHYYQINSSTDRCNILVPLSSDAKTTYFYPDVVYVGENVSSTLPISILDLTGTAFVDSGGATLEYAYLLFEYVVE